MLQQKWQVTDNTEVNGEMWFYSAVE